MTLEQAIGILQFNGAPEEGPTISAFLEARNLSIEALKEIKNQRSFWVYGSPTLLPGETGEVK